MSKLETNTIDTVSGTSTLQVGSTNTSTITLGVSGDTINVPSGVTIANSGTATGFGGTNTPAFFAYLGTTTTISNNSQSVVPLNSELFDVGGCFNNTSSSTTLNGITAPAYSFTPNESGKYLIGIKSLISTSGTQYNISYIIKNTAAMLEVQNQNEQGARRSQTGSTIVELNGTGDYVTMQMYQSSGSGQSLYGGDEHTQMFGYKIIE